MHHTAFEGGIHLRIFLEGQDTKEGYLAQMLRHTGHIITNQEPFDLMILNIPRTSIPDTQLSRIPGKQKILCGLINDSFLSMAREKEWQLFPVLQDEKYTAENAILSAEGALYAAMRQADFSVGSADCLIIGYGRIGKALTKMLRGLGAHVTVAARRKESRIEAGNGISIEDIPVHVSGMQLIFNTVPAPIMGKEQLSKVNQDALLIELASPPYGIALEAAREMNLRAWGEWGIPGRYSPQSAARLIMDYLEREVFS